MELQIQDLVTSIKKEGIDAARVEADRIIAQAKEQAAAILAEAQTEAKRMEEKTQNELDVMKDGAKMSIEHAKRDAMLSFKDAVQGEFEKLLAADVSKTVNGETLTTLIKAALNGEKPGDYAAEVTEISDGLKGELAQEIQNGLEIRTSTQVRSGFRLAAKDGSGYFDCTDEEITQMLKPFFPELSL